jgi:fructokinase
MVNRPVIVGIGEILWDVFPEGPKFGGAPANFACCAAELSAAACEVFLVGSVGRDELGRRAVELLTSHGVDTRYVSTNEFPTGQVLVSLDDAGRPSFEFASNTAWDNVVWCDELAALAARADVVCFGTLAQRSPVTRQTIRRFLQAVRPDCLRILDINLRPPFWSEDVLRESLALANALKLNDGELATLTELWDLHGTDDAKLRELLHASALQFIALTSGPNGSTLMRADGTHSSVPGERVAVADTVGAGDAFTAALALGVSNESPLDEINRWASRVAAYVCTQPGGTPHLPQELRHG